MRGSIMAAATKPAHTPGPWGVVTTTDRFGGVNSDIAVTVGGELRFIATVGHAYDQDWRQDSQIEADAFLLAAAPDLLEALRYLAEDNDVDWRDSKAKRLALHALAKAEGRES